MKTVVTDQRVLSACKSRDLSDEDIARLSQEQRFGIYLKYVFDVDEDWAPVLIDVLNGCKGKKSR